MSLKEKGSKKPDKGSGRARGRGRGGSLRGGRGRGGAMNVFKQMDKQNAPAGGTQRNFGGGRTPPGAKSPGAIKEALLTWCQKATEGYKNVEITNFSTSWNDGMAFAALIHRFKPDSLDFDALDPANRAENFKTAFEAAEKHADIAPLLDVEDMVKYKKPDWKCVFCYVQMFYRAFHTVDIGLKVVSDNEEKPEQKDEASSSTTTDELKEKVEQVTLTDDDKKKQNETSEK